MKKTRGKCLLQLLCAVVRTDCTMTSLHCGQCEGRSEGQKTIESDSAPSGIEEGKEREGSDFGKERSGVKMEQNRCELV